MALASTALLPDGLEAISDRYDAVLLDQFGVLHDGKQAQSGALEVYQKLASMGVLLAIVSNTSKRQASARRGLGRLGYDPSSAQAVVTSGEEAWKYLAKGKESLGLASPGKRANCLWLTWRSEATRDTNFLQGLNVQATGVDDADFVLAHGSDGIVLDSHGTFHATGFKDSGSLEAYHGLLRRAAERGLPLICANPDSTVVNPDQSVAYMPGNFARYYAEECGGQVLEFGKPDPAHFEAAIQGLEEAKGSPIERSRVLHIGDSLEHDIHGATAAGIDSLFIASGVHGAELGVQLDEGASSGVTDRLVDGEATVSRLQGLLEQYSASPTYTAEVLSWKGISS